jgi:hypothetical protein
VRGNVVRFRRRIRALQKQFDRGEIEWGYVKPRLQAWNAHAANGNTWRLREQIFEQNQFTQKKRK